MTDQLPPAPANIQTRRLTSAQFQHMLAMQKVPSWHYAFKCPRCGTVHSYETLKRAGMGASEQTLEPHIGCTCPSCEWTLYPPVPGSAVAPIVVYQEMSYFEPASPEEAQALRASWRNQGSR